MPETITSLHAMLMDPDRIPVALLAILISLLAGLVPGPHRTPALPVLWKPIQRLSQSLANRLERRRRPEQDMTLRGIALALIVCSVTLALIAAFRMVIALAPASGATAGAILALALASGVAFPAVRSAQRRMANPSATDKDGSWYPLAVATGLDLNGNDQHGAVRITAVYLARLFDKGMVAPTLWFLIGGLPLALLQATLSAAVWKVGRMGQRGPLTRPLLALEKLMGMIPTLTAGTLIALAALLTPGAGMTRSLIALIRSPSGRAPYAEGGAAVTAMAWALSVTLGGPMRDQDGTAFQTRWTGPDNATARLSHTMVPRILYLYAIAHLLWFAALLGAYTVSGHGFVMLNN